MQSPEQSVANRASQARENPSMASGKAQTEVRWVHFASLTNLEQFQSQPPFINRFFSIIVKSSFLAVTNTPAKHSKPRDFPRLAQDILSPTLQPFEAKKAQLLRANTIRVQRALQNATRCPPAAKLRRPWREMWAATLLASARLRREQLLRPKEFEPMVAISLSPIRSARDPTHDE